MSIEGGNDTAREIHSTGALCSTVVDAVLEVSDGTKTGHVVSRAAPLAGIGLDAVEAVCLSKISFLALM